MDKEQEHDNRRLGKPGQMPCHRPYKYVNKSCSTGAALIAAVLSISGVHQSLSYAEEIPPIKITTATVPSATPSTDAEIRSFDFAVDAQEALHLGWIVNPTPSRLTPEKLFYARGERGGAHWSKPRELASDCPSFVRVLVATDGVHILCGGKLRHFFSADNGDSWRELEPLLSDTEDYALVADAIGVDDGLIAAYLNRGIGASGATGIGLYLVKHSSGKGATSHRIASLAGDSPTALRLAADKRQLHLLAAVTGERQIKEKNYTRFEFSARLSYLRSQDAGATWSAPVEILSNTTPEAPVKSADIQAIGPTLELTPLGRELFAFYHNIDLYTTYTADGSAWSSPINITSYQPSWRAGAFYSRSVSAAAIDGRGRLAWIDSRYRKSDRQWWNPLGGWPWSDAPDWANNDIFMLPLADIVTIVKGGQKPRYSPTPERLTAPLSYAEQAQLRASHTKLFMLWSGRRKVGKQFDSFGQPAELFYTVLPLLYP